MDEAEHVKLTFRCPRGLENVLPKPIPASLGLPDWFKALPQRAFNPTLGGQTFTVKKCPPFIDAMTYGFLIPLATDLEVRDGEFSWNFELPEGIAGDRAYAPIDFHDPSQVAGTPFFDEDRFIIKFSNLWTIQAPEGYSLLFTHPVNRRDLPFTTLTGLVDCDAYHNNPLHFPARWSDPTFNGVLPKGTPVAQCLPVKREIWVGEFDALSDEETAQSMQTRDAILQGTDVYRRQFRMPKR
jgi:hypothetical protein